MKNKMIRPNNESPTLKSNPKSGSINYSPDKDNFYYICPYVWDPVFANYDDEIDYVEAEISLYGYPITNYVIDELKKIIAKFNK